MVKVIILIFVLGAGGILGFNICNWVEQIIGRIQEDKKEFRYFKPVILKIYEKHSYLIKLLSGLLLLVIWTLLINFPLGILFGGVGFFIPSLVVRRVKALRVKQFERQLLQGLGIISTSLRAGASLEQSLEAVAGKVQPPFSEEIGEVLREIQLGVSPEESLNNLARRIPSPDLLLSVHALNIGRETGGNLPEILDRMMMTMRSRAQINEKVSALTAQGRLSGVIVSILPIILLGVVSYISPDLTHPLFHTFIGNLCLAVAFILISLGGFFIQRIVRIEI